jgi:hypothetical protein
MLESWDIGTMGFETADLRPPGGSQRGWLHKTICIQKFVEIRGRFKFLRVEVVHDRYGFP